MKEITWGCDDNPYEGDLSDVPQDVWAKVSHVRLGYGDGEEDFEWVRFNGFDDRGYRLKIGRSRDMKPYVCPEDVWGLRLKED
jgi:hypothetical protein